MKQGSHELDTTGLSRSYRKNKVKLNKLKQDRPMLASEECIALFLTIKSIANETETR